MKDKHIAVIGGGASGMVLIIYLAKYAKQSDLDLHKLHLHLIDPHGFGWGGIAYGECAPQHILNTRRNEISPWETNGFRDFLIKKGRVNDDLQFDLRSDCLEFLQTEFATSLQTLIKLGCKINKHKESVLIEQTEEGLFSVINKDSKVVDEALKKIPASQIILTVGYGPNTNFSDLKQYVGGGYIHSLYPYENIKNEPALIKKSPKIAIAGSSAALYDFVLAYPGNPAETTLYIFSQVGESGQVVREVEIEDTFKKIDLEPLLSIQGKASTNDIEEAIKQIFKKSKEDDAGSKSWVAFNIMLIIGSVLERVSENTAIEFHSSLFFKKIRRLGGPTTQIASDKLSEFKTEFIQSDLSAKNIERINDSFLISVDGGKYEVDCLVNATGHGRTNTSILEKMQKDGLAIVNKKTGVLKTDDTGYRLISSKIACIGPAVHFGTDGIQTFARPADALATEILNGLQ